MHPILFTIPTPWGELPVFSYGVMLGASLVVAWYVVMWLGATREGLSRDRMGSAFLVTAAGGLVGARLLYALTNLDELPTPRQWLDFGQGGLVAYGGFLGGFAGSLAYCRLRRVPLLSWADVVAPTLASGLALTRVGCYLFGCDFGTRLGADAPAWLRAAGTFPRWSFEGMRLAIGSPPRGSPAFLYHRLAYDLPASATSSHPVHPTQLYEALAGLVLLGVVLRVWRRRRFRGQPLLVLVMGYGVFRFVVEHWRDDPGRGTFAGLSTSQLISLALVPLAGLLYARWNAAARDAGYPPVPTLRDPPLPKASEGEGGVGTRGADDGPFPAAPGGGSVRSVARRKRGARRL